jgi:peptidoglycan hydrolase FlgJ
MAFNPRSDIVLEVLNAADPARAALAAERLTALGGGNPPGASFAASLERAAASAAATPGLADARSLAAALAGSSDPAARAKVDFEATLLNPLIGELLPKDAPSLFGAGTAGDMWRSMLSEQISRQIAKSGALGISRRLFATHELTRREASAHAAADTGSAAQMSPNILAAPSAAEAPNGAVLVATRKRA